MIIRKLALPRRTILRGIGAAMALPFLDAMVPAFSTTVARAAGTPTRLGFFYIPNGAIMDSWTPAAVGTHFEFSPILQPLAPFKSQLLVLTGLSQKAADSIGDGNGDHSRATPAWLSAVHPKRTEGADVQGGVTADQLAARELGRSTQLASLELGMDANYLVGNCENGYSCVYMNTISWRTPTQPIPMENNPRIVFERMFGDGGSADARRSELRKNRSLLDSVTEEMARLQRTLGNGDRAKVNEYVEAVRDIERRIEQSETQSTRTALPDTLDRPVGIPETFEQHLALMYDLQVLAYQADITRVISFVLGRELSQRTYPLIGIADPHHGLTHHAGDKAKIEKVVKINTYHAQLFGHFLEKMRATPDGDGSLLDHSMILYGGGISDGNGHTHHNLPLLLAGGGGGQIKGGRHLKYENDTPMANLLVSMLDKAGVATERFGDSTGRLEHLSDI
jgi:hypothetical protein